MPSTSAASSVLASLADLLDPADDSADVFAQLEYEPICVPRVQARKLGRFPLPEPCGQCPQEQFHEASEFDVLYGGAAGGGKTRALVADAIRDAVRYPGIRIGAFRRTFGELRESLLAELFQLNYKATGATWNGSEYELRFRNGSLVMFRYAETLVDATRRQGGQYQKLIFDERTLTPPDVIQFLMTRLRSGRADLPVIGIRSGTNPGGIGHSAVKARYIEPTEHGQRVVVEEKTGRTIRFIQSKASDNPYLNEEYTTDLDTLPEGMRKAFRDGDWDVFAGQVFSEWRYDRHVVEPFPLSDDWRRHGGIDYGYRAPSAVIWAAQDQDKRLWVYDELYETQLGEKGLAAKIKAKTGERHVAFAFDPSMMSQVGDALPSATVLQQEGILLRKGNNDRLSGWQRIHSYLAEGPLCAHHRALAERGAWDTDTCPLLHVFSSCAELIRTLPAVPYNTTGRLEDVDTKAEDHLPDALRYLVMELGHTGGVVFDESQPASALDGSPLAENLMGGRFAVVGEGSLPF